MIDVKLLCAAVLVIGAGLAGGPTEKSGQAEQRVVEPAPDTSSPVASATPRSAELQVGRYAYMADAAIMIDCFTGEMLPVAFTADHLSLEQAYLATQETTAETLTVVYQGYIEEREAMEEGLMQEQVVITKFHAIVQDLSCDGEPPAELVAGSWTLSAINEMAIVPPADHRPPSLTFQTDSSLTGFTGCNVLNGRYVAAGAAVRIGRVATTKKYCPRVADLETSFVQKLARVISCRMDSDRLILQTADQDSLILTASRE